MVYKFYHDRRVETIIACHCHFGDSTVEFLALNLKSEGYNMKKGIHPDYNEVIASCACGAQFKTGSTLKEVRVDICSACHPLFTGKQKILDTEGRVDKFNKRLAVAKKTKKTKK
jgi:large subunit ribosomal protein L31